MSRDPALRALTALFALFFAAIGIVALIDPPARGWAVLGLVAAFNVALPLVARAVGRDDWLALWAFLLPVSVFQVVPDWVLSDLIGTLRFPSIGGLRVDDVIPIAMGGMWVPPLFAVLALAGTSAVRAACISLVVFLGSELMAPALGLWEPTAQATQVAGVALYVLPAEAALGWAAWFAFDRTRGAGPATRIGAAAAVSTFYLGALVTPYFVIDVAGWRITA